MGANPKLEYRSAIVVVHPDGLALLGGMKMVDWQAELPPTQPKVMNAEVLLVNGVPVAAGLDRRLTVPK